MKKLSWVLVWLALPAARADYVASNDFVRGAFPKKTSTRVFSIPLDPEQVTVVYPAGARDRVDAMRGLLRAKCGRDIPFKSADEMTAREMAARHVILIGNLSSNQWSLALYKKRYAFGDAYFPGKGGYAIHPAKNIWNPERNVLAIDVSSDADVPAAFEAFTGMLERGARSIVALRRLKTGLKFPQAPETVAPVLAAARTELDTAMAPYGAIANWGLSYALTGDRRWARHMLEGYRVCYERAEKTGRWIPEPWTNVYFNLWKMVYAWELVDDDPIFTPAERGMIDEVLWGYTKFSDWLPNLDENLAPPDEPRQNHTTFLGLSLFYAHRYFTGKYGITGLDGLMTKCRRTFEHGEASSYRPNDDAGGYVVLAPLHLLIYDMARDDDSFLRSGKLRELASLAAATLDNRNDPPSFGDVGGYRHRTSGAPRGTEAIFFGMAAWYYHDPQFQWLYRWTSDNFSFHLEELYSGTYAVEMPEKPPASFTGVQTVLLDEAALRWSAMRTTRPEDLPARGARYVDKLAMRNGFEPAGEYLLLDGTSTFSHGHQDGNTVTRLTWNDRLWLYESDYMKLTPRYHMGVVVTRDGVQEPPPPLTTLDASADFAEAGLSRTTARDFNGCDWSRSIIWKKGRYFLVLDDLTARRDGNYRLEGRWRAVGETRLEGSVFTARQGEQAFRIGGADDAERRILPESGTSPAVSICYSRKELPLARGGRYRFANLMDAGAQARELLAAAPGLYAIRDGASVALAGTDASALKAVGIDASGGPFLLDADGLIVADRKIPVPAGSAERIARLDLRRVEPQARAVRADFGLRTEYRPHAGITAWAEGVYGDDKGGIYRFPETLVGRVPSGSAIRAVYADSRAVVAGDAAGNLYCYSPQGTLVWTRKLRSYRGATNAVSIIAADIDSSGTPTYLVTTTGWMLHAFRPDGTLRWAAFTKYHQQTLVKFRKPYIAVGTVYETPLNILSPDGKLLWNTWEEMGSEFLSTTEYCGIHLTDMLFPEGTGEIVFGTLSNRVTALGVSDGKTKWDANVGDEVTAIRPLAGGRLAVATGGGDVMLYDLSGRRLRAATLAESVTDLRVIPFPEHARNDLVATTGEGSVLVSDDSLRIRAAVHLTDAPVLAILDAGTQGRDRMFHAVTAAGVYTVRYAPYFLWQSRDY